MQEIKLYTKKNMEDIVIPINNATDFNEHFPETVYKYRDWDNENHKKIITSQELFFPSFESLNDPFDGKLPFMFDNSGIDKKTYKKELRKNNPFEYNNLTKNKIDEKYRNFQSGKDWKSMLKYHIEFVNSIYGIMSLSESATITPMWAHYGNNHSGIAIGFNLFELHKIVQGTISRIKYTEEPVKIPFGNTEDIYSYQNLFFTKSPEWSYEKEIRILKTHFSNKKIQLNKNTISEIVFGMNAEAKNIEEIKSITNKNFENVTFFKVYKNNKKSVLDIKPI